MDIRNDTMPIADQHRATLVSGNKAMQILELSRHSFEKIVKDGLLTIISEGGKNTINAAKLKPLWKLTHIKNLQMALSTQEIV